MARTIFIGDIHGCLDEFQELVERLAVGPDDRVICLGDFMDKGPAGAACVKFAREFGFEALLGNHEDKHLRWHKHEAARKSNPAYRNPMRPLPEEAQVQNELLSDEDVDWLSSLPVTLEVDNWVAVHGGLLPGLPLEDQERDKLLRVRYVTPAGEYVGLKDDGSFDPPPNSCCWMESYDGPRNVVYGHAVHSLSSPRVDLRPQGVACYGIDTGVVYGGRLTALILSDGRVSEVVQVLARRRYLERP